MSTSRSGRGPAVLVLATALVMAGCYIEVNIVTGDDDDETQVAAVAEAGAAPATAAPRAPRPPRSDPPAPVGRRRTRALGVQAELIVPPPLPVPDDTPREPRLSDGPTFTPYTVAPAVLNRTEVVRALETEYPPLLRSASIGGTTRVYFLIDGLGQVRNVQVDRSSGHQALDEAALRVARAFRFAAAQNAGVPVPVWVSFPITFQAR